ncbi:AraC family transcriptional regulator [Kitasatospora sp. NPDC004240]
MDILSDVVSAMRTGEPRSARVEWYAPWGQRFLPAAGGGGFTVILQGACWLIPDAGEPVALGAGDVLFLSRGRGYALADHPSSPLAEAACDPRTGRRVERRPGRPVAGGPVTGDPVTGEPVTGVRRHELRYAAPPVGGPRPDGTPPTAITLCGAYQLDPARAHPLLHELPDIVHLPARLGPGSPIRAAVELLGGELASPGLGTDTVVPALLDTLLLLVLREWFERAPSERRPEGAAAGWAGALRDPAVAAALDAVHREPAHGWTVAGLAARAGLSRAAFARRFAVLVGRPPLDYLTWWRMTLAAGLLRDSELPLGAVAGRVGYGSESALTAAFRREYGTAPGRYRAERRGPGPGRGPG